MSPLYAECPYCTFPAVVPMIERESPRYCRQCRRKFMPEEAALRSRQPVAGPAEANRRRRLVALRALMQPRPKRAL